MHVLADIAGLGTSDPCEFGAPHAILADRRRRRGCPTCAFNRSDGGTCVSDAMPTMLGPVSAGGRGGSSQAVLLQCLENPRALLLVK